MSCIGTKIFGGKRYTYLHMHTSKAKAEADIKSLHNANMCARIEKSEDPSGKRIYLVFTRFKK